MECCDSIKASPLKFNHSIHVSKALARFYSPLGNTTQNAHHSTNNVICSLYHELTLQITYSLLEATTQQSTMSKTSHNLIPQTVNHSTNLTTCTSSHFHQNRNASQRVCQSFQNHNTLMKQSIVPKDNKNSPRPSTHTSMTIPQLSTNTQPSLSIN
ncbi:hypothetical protein O6H91_05G039600 [Diphasiastrum complanatum]|uniref:Uncharacterized protein n=1 Tax=Diphasiastrum complanatum TaxID=34168 RepID=A0ACC2DMH9_DIPCM|nr:hypothetical protein O6H91_05G039600 [Diphasiastrum complanatum]